MGFAATYGASYVLTLYSNYAILYRVSYDEEGKAAVDRLSSTNSHVRLNDVGEAEFELRCDRKDATMVRGHHNLIFCGDYTRRFRMFANLYRLRLADTDYEGPWPG